MFTFLRIILLLFTVLLFYIQMRISLLLSLALVSEMVLNSLHEVSHNTHVNHPQDMQSKTVILVQEKYSERKFWKVCIKWHYTYCKQVPIHSKYCTQNWRHSQFLSVISSLAEQKCNNIHFRFVTFSGAEVSGSHVSVSGHLALVPHKQASTLCSLKGKYSLGIPASGQNYLLLQRLVINKWANQSGQCRLGISTSLHTVAV